jgi:hypothetical protein
MVESSGTKDMTEDTIKRRARGLDRAFDILDFLKEIGQPLRPRHRQWHRQPQVHGL